MMMVDGTMVMKVVLAMAMGGTTMIKKSLNIKLMMQRFPNYQAKKVRTILIKSSFESSNKMKSKK